MKLSVVVPAHNEEGHILGIVGDLRTELLKEKVDFEIIVVDDNSADRTGELADGLAKEHGDVRVVHRRGRNGFGMAVRDGLAAATGDCAIIVMADKSDDPEDVVKIFRKLEEGYDVVYGSRFIRGSEIHNYPPFKLVVNRLANHFIMALFLMKENDITNAFKGYNMRVIRSLWPLDAKHFNITAELPLKARTHGFSRVAVPVRWYGRESGVSKLSLIRMGQRYLRTVLGIWFMWIWHIEPIDGTRKGPAISDGDEHWEKYWLEKEANNILGRLIFMLRERFWVNTFVEFAVRTSMKGSVLEAGSGSALSSIYLARRRADRVTALDISSAALNKAKESAERLGVRLGLVRGDLNRLPFADKAFGLVWNSGTMEHFSDPGPVFKEMARVGREVVCIVPAKNFIFSLIGFVSGMFGKDFKSYFLREDEIFYLEDTLKGVLERAGLREVVVKRIYCLGVFPYIAAYCKT